MGGEDILQQLSYNISSSKLFTQRGSLLVPSLFHRGASSHMRQEGKSLSSKTFIGEGKGSIFRRTFRCIYKRYGDSLATKSASKERWFDGFRKVNLGFSLRGFPKINNQLLVKLLSGTSAYRRCFSPAGQ